MGSELWVIWRWSSWQGEGGEVGWRLMGKGGILPSSHIPLYSLLFFTIPIWWALWGALASYPSLLFAIGGIIPIFSSGRWGELPSDHDLFPDPIYQRWNRNWIESIEERKQEWLFKDCNLNVAKWLRYKQWRWVALWSRKCDLRPPPPSPFASQVGRHSEWAQLAQIMAIIPKYIKFRKTYRLNVHCDNISRHWKKYDCLWYLSLPIHFQRCRIENGFSWLCCKKLAVFGCLTVKLGRPGRGGLGGQPERERERVIEIFIPRRPLFLVLALPARL